MQLVQTAPPVVVAAPPPASLHHVGITVTDLDRSVAWYGEMLGMVQWMEETYPGGRTAGLMRPGTHVHVGLDAHDRNDGETSLRTAPASTICASALRVVPSWTTGVRT